MDVHSEKRLTRGLPGWRERSARRSPCVVGVLPGEGVGPEVVGAALVVLAAVAAETDLPLDIRHGEVRQSRPARGELDEAVAGFCESIFAEGGALLCGPEGGRFVYDLRRRFDLYCKVVPFRPSPALEDCGAVRPERRRGVDILLVRENVAGLYQGAFGWRAAGRVAWQTCSYAESDVSRILAAAAALARSRRGRLSVVVKTGGLPEVSRLWSEQAEQLAERHDIETEILEADNASFQLVADPQRWDVVVAPNLFGDMLADSTTLLLGSRGMSYSGNFGAGGRAAYQTGHGAARDLAGRNAANPVAQILSLAMLLRESFGRVQEALRIEAAVEAVLASGVRTRDIAGAASRVVGTQELARCIAEAAAKHPPTPV